MERDRVIIRTSSVGIGVKQPERNIQSLDLVNMIFILKKLWKKPFALQMPA